MDRRLWKGARVAMLWMACLFGAFLWVAGSFFGYQVPSNDPWHGLYLSLIALISLLVLTGQGRASLWLAVVFVSILLARVNHTSWDLGVAVYAPLSIIFLVAFVSLLIELGQNAADRIPNQQLSDDGYEMD